jgi:hypothetical protein
MDCPKQRCILTRFDEMCISNRSKMLDTCLVSVDGSLNLMLEEVHTVAKDAWKRRLSSLSPCVWM